MMEIDLFQHIKKMGTLLSTRDGDEKKQATKVDIRIHEISKDEKEESKKIRIRLHEVNAGVNEESKKGEMKIDETRRDKESGKWLKSVKANFSYIEAIKHKDYIPKTEEDLEKEERSDRRGESDGVEWGSGGKTEVEGRVLSLQELLQEGQSKMQERSITVQWNTFVKIKKRNYLDDYRVVKRIGRGAYGQVLKIKMKYGEMYRAAKVIRSSRLLAQATKQKLFAEIAIPLKLDHPNINKLLEVFDWGQEYVLVMELCDRGDLFKCISSGRLFEECRVLSIMKQLLSAVHYLHRQRVVHRDFKPQNILLDEQDGQIKIIDFGSATYFSEGDWLSEMVGTPYYMAPEVIERRYDEKCDVWSCGVIMYMLLCGVPPFGGGSADEIMHNVCHQQLDFSNKAWRRRSPQSRHLVASMLQRSVAQRVTALDALNHSWMGAEDVASAIPSATKLILNLSTFQFKNRLQAVVHTYIASQLYQDKDKHTMLSVFKAIDKDRDGMLEKEELRKVFIKLGEQGIDVQQILKIVDTNQSGAIDFTEFLVAVSGKDKLTGLSLLKSAFEFLDSDHSGFITIQEICKFLDGSSETDEEIRRIFSSVDLNQDGTISKEEFIYLMTKD